MGAGSTEGKASEGPAEVKPAGMMGVVGEMAIRDVRVDADGSNEFPDRRRGKERQVGSSGGKGSVAVRGG